MMGNEQTTTSAKPVALRNKLIAQIKSKCDEMDILQKEYQDAYSRFEATDDYSDINYDNITGQIRKKIEICANEGRELEWEFINLYGKSK